MILWVSWMLTGLISAGNWGYVVYNGLTHMSGGWLDVFYGHDLVTCVTIQQVIPDHSHGDSHRVPKSIQLASLSAKLLFKPLFA